jgi:hypothetical protein
MTGGKSIFLFVMALSSFASSISYGTIHVKVTIAKVFLVSQPGQHRETPIPLEQPRENTPMSQEETEDDDDTTTEKLLHKVSLAALSQFLELLYARQHTLFENIPLEIEIPPPRFS